MTTTRQLYQLQEIDLESDTQEHSLREKSSQLGAREHLDRAQHALETRKQELAELKRRQRSLENDIDSLSEKLAGVETQLYGGRVFNPKELSSLQQEANLLKGRRDQKETEALEMMDRVEVAGADVAALEGEFLKMEESWQKEQQQLKEAISEINKKLAELQQKRALLVDTIDPATLVTYESIRRQKGQAMAKVSQGVCHTCRISVSSRQLQQARSGALVHCDSCGRILYLP